MFVSSDPAKTKGNVAPLPVAVSETGQVHMALTDCLERIIPNYGRVLMQSKPTAIAALPIPLDVGKSGLWQTIFSIWCWRYGYDLTQSNAKTSVALTEKLSMINI